MYFFFYLHKWTKNNEFLAVKYVAHLHTENIELLSFKSFETE